MHTGPEKQVRDLKREISFLKLTNNLIFDSTKQKHVYTSVYVSTSQYSDFKAKELLLNRENFCNYQGTVPKNNYENCVIFKGYSTVVKVRGGLTWGQKGRLPPLFFFFALFENLTSVKIASYGFKKICPSPPP